MLIVHLFIFRIKSKCCVEFSNSDQASSDQVLMTFYRDNDRQARRGWLWTASPGPPSTPRPSEWHFLQRFAAPTFLIRLASVYFWLNLFFANHNFSPSFTQEEMKKLAEGGDDVGVAGRVGVELEGRSLLRDWDRNKVNMMLLICS